MTDVLPLLLPLVLGVAYYRRATHLARDGHPPSTARQLSFAGGLLLLAIATVGPMDELGDDLVFGHMIQHTILTDEAALLLALGLTGPVLRPILSAPGLRHLRVLMHPVVAILLWIVVIYAWHAPPLYEAAAEHTLIHLLEHASFLGAGLVVWLALLGAVAEAGVVRAHREGRLHRGRLLLEHGTGQHPDVVGHRALPGVRTGRARAAASPPSRTRASRGRS